MSIEKGTPTKDGRQYYFRKSKNNHQYMSKKYHSHDEAEKAEALYILKNDTPIKIKFCTVADAYFENLKETKKVSTYNSYVKAYKVHIKPFFEKSYIHSINTENIRKWAVLMANKKKLSSNGKLVENATLSTAYLNKVYVILCNIFKHAIKNYSLDVNPVSMYGRFEDKQPDKIADKKRDYITLDEFNKFIDVIQDPLWYAYFNFLFYAGVRKGEAMALHWTCIDFDTNRITIKATLQVDIKGIKIETPTKTGKERIIIMNEELYKILLNYKNNLKKNFNDFSDNWYVFGNASPISKTTADRKKHEYFEKANVYEITSHQFRHSLSTLLCMEYVKHQQEMSLKIDKYAFLSALANRNGHTVETMMKYYAKLFPDVEQDQVVSLLNNLSNKNTSYKTK